MPDPPTINAGTLILHYRILRPLGSGGMGIVYEAEDTRLGRHVALKFLPPELAADPAALERFKREARAASALNHPNICTIHAIEDANGARFIAMELLEGESLDRRIANQPLSWDALVSSGTQIADALAAAHARGIIHRDVKPANIFLTKDGRAKVLDFGIAKIGRHGAGQGETIGATAAQQALTGAGATVGTIAYMSPEQARGDELDARTDIFSLGAVLYEMSTGRRAFEGKTTALVFNNILESNPPAPRELNPSLPPKLEDVILRALEKDPELRYQSAADLRADLKRLKRDATAGRLSFVPPAPVSASAPLSSGAVLAAEARRHKGLAGTLTLALLFGTAAAAYGTYAFLTRERAATTVTPQLARTAPTRITTSGDVRGCGSISPDGKYVVYCDFAGELKLRQVATGAVVVLGKYIGDTTFSPDSDHVYLSVKSGAEPAGVLLRIPTLGGDAQRIATRLGGPVGVSPDGQRIAFVRLEPAKREATIVSVSARGGDERIIATSSVERTWFDEFGVAWSPDGRFLSATQGTVVGGFRMRPVIVDAVSGNVTTLGTRTWSSVGRSVWLPGTTAILFTAREHLAGPYQFYVAEVASGEVSQITNETRGFGSQSVSVTADGTTLATIQNETIANIWSTNADATAPLEQWTSGARFDGGSGIAPMPNGRLLYGSDDGSEMSIWSVDGPGGRPRRVVQGYAEIPDVPNDGSFLAFQAIHEGRYRIWRAGPDGSDPRVLTRGEDDIVPRVSADGRWIYYWSAATLQIIRMASDGSQPRVLSDLPVAPGSISPDGREMLLTTNDSSLAATHIIIDAETGAIKKKFDLNERRAGFGRRQDLLLYARSQDGIDNLWEQPVAGGPPRQLTKFTSGNIFGFSYNPDRTRLFISRGERTGDVVVLRNFR